MYVGNEYTHEKDLHLKHNAKLAVVRYNNTQFRLALKEMRPIRTETIKQTIRLFGVEP